MPWSNNSLTCLAISTCFIEDCLLGGKRFAGTFHLGKSTVIEKGVRVDASLGNDKAKKNLYTNF